MFVDEAPPITAPFPVQGPVPITETDVISEMSTSEVEREICDLAARIAAATCRWLTLAAEFDRRRGHEAFGFASCASWLAWRCSITPRAAREQLRVARALRELPRIRSAFGAGLLTYSKVRALTRVAEPEMEPELLEIARHATAAQLERVLRGYRKAIAPDTAAETTSRRRLTTQWEDDGRLTVRASLPPEEAALFLRGLDHARDELRSDARAATAGNEPAEPEARREQPDRVDALVALAETSLTRGIAAASGGDRNQVVVHIDLDALTGNGGEATATLAEGPALPAETIRRLGCDAAVVSLVERDGEPLSVGRKTRSIPPSLARALRRRDRGCRFPGCECERFVDAHHVHHWAHGGETSLDNLLLLCRRHHRLIHEGGFTVELEGGEPVFTAPNGRRLAAVPALPAVNGPESRPRAKSPIDPESVIPLSQGDRIDYDHAAFVFAKLAERRGVATAL